MSRPARGVVAAGPGSNPNRRLSQPIYPGGAPSQGGGRRTSEMMGTPRVDPLPPSQGGAPPPYDDLKLGGDKTRKVRAGKDNPDSGSFDPEMYNPDGSLRTMHRIPSFTDAYAQAGKARYIRHKELIDREKELSVKQIFDNNS